MKLTPPVFTCDVRSNWTPPSGLPILCLAVETGSELFHEIAAGITLIERRAGGQSPANETIMLATS